MAKLYPPVLESTIPACYSENGAVKITVPFSMNRAVSASQIGGFELKIKTIQTGSYLYTVQAVNSSQFSITESESHVTFYLKDVESKLKVGQFYKIQMAYLAIDEAVQKEQYALYITNEITLEEYEAAVIASCTVGYYSTTAIIKYTTKPTVYINNFQTNIANNYTYTYTGYYSQQGGDPTEKVYSYCFNIYDNNKSLILTSNEQVHNSSNDTNAELSFDKYSIMFDLQYNIPYYIQYTVTTTNQIKISTPLYQMIQRETIDPELFIDFVAELNFDNGYIDLYMSPRGGENEIGYPSSGSFIVSRASKDSNFSQWEELYRFKLYETIPQGFLFRDFTIQQGKTYSYSIQQYNDYGLYSKRIYSNNIIADFEDAFLYDGEKQLKIRYNPKMSKFTNTILETKQDTIGSQYPFIFRNGQVNYHEFPIAGLISYSMDDGHLFLSPRELIFDGFTIDYTSENVAQERMFKRTVLEWLNNGKPKLFRSPTEGNFLVRLMKVSLSPEDKLGRLLHTFNCTAYEIAECNNINLQKFNILDPKEPELQIFQQKTLNLANYIPGATIRLEVPDGGTLNSIRFENMTQGDIINITYANQSKESLVIGPTQTLQLDNISFPIAGLSIAPKYFLDLDVTAKDIQDNPGKYYLLENGVFTVCDMYTYGAPYYKISNIPLKGLITYGYMLKRDNSFSKIKNVSFRNPIVRQFIGEHDILKEIEYLDEETKNPKIELMDFYYIKAEKRPVDRIIAESIDEETLEDGNEFYYGALNEKKENRSERFPLIELMYPVGLRKYTPATYYVKNSEGEYKKQTIEEEEYDINQTYYLKGRYVKTRYPVGLVGYNPGMYYTKSTDPLTGEDVYTLSNGEWQEGVEYYSQSRNLKGRISYHLVEYMTHDKNYVFEENKFYRKTSKIINGKIIYTLARKFNPDFYNNKQYYTLDESYDEYVDAYVTINDNYVYRPYEYYIHITNVATNKDVYMMSGALEYNINELTMAEGDEAEYEGDIIKYYRIKTILPHILHEVGINWIESTDNKIGYNADALYNFQPKKYKDFYNNKDYPLNEYQPYIIINGEKININDTLFFTVSDLKNAKKLYELKSGNGVVVEVMYDVKDYEYNIEKSLSSRQGYEEALVALDTYLSYLSLDPSDEKYVDISDVTNELYDIYYHQTPYTNASVIYTGLSVEIAQMYKE